MPSTTSLPYRMVAGQSPPNAIFIVEITVELPTPGKFVKRVKPAYNSFSTWYVITFAVTLSQDNKQKEAAQNILNQLDGGLFGFLEPDVEKQTTE